MKTWISFVLFLSEREVPLPSCRFATGPTCMLDQICYPVQVVLMSCARIHRGCRFLRCAMYDAFWVVRRVEFEDLQQILYTGVCGTVPLPCCSSAFVGLLAYIFCEPLSCMCSGNLQSWFAEASSFTFCIFPVFFYFGLVCCFGILTGWGASF